MIDPRFYEHRARDPFKPIIGVVVLSLAVFVFALWGGSIVTANRAHCPTWLHGIIPARPLCLAGPLSGVMWNLQYRTFVKPEVKYNIMSRWPRAKRINFYSALDASYDAAVIGFVLMIVTNVIAITTIVKKKKTQRVMIDGTRFWANDDEVFATGLAVNYKLPIRARFKAWLAK